MANPIPDDHWSKLMSDLGVTKPPTSTAAETSEILPAEPASSLAELPPLPAPTITPAPAARHTARPRPASNWESLASELGVVAPSPREVSRPAMPLPDPVSRPVVVVREPKPAETCKPLIETPVEPVEKVHESEAEELAPTDVEMEIWDAPIVNLIQPPAASPIPEASLEPAIDRVPYQAPESLSKSGRRRRRRRRRGQRLPEPETTESEIQEVDLEAAADSVELIDEPEPAPTNAAEPSAAPASSDTRERRRRRRRSRKKTTDGVEPSEARPSAKPADDHDDDDEGWLGATQDAPEHADDDDASAHTWSHKGIPTWAETIDTIVARNLESRAKNPNSGSGGRARGNRRSRDRSSDRSK